MRVETPQILWHSEEDKGINAALMSVSMIQSGLVDGAAAASAASVAVGSSSNNNNSLQYGNVLATAGNSNLIHLWKVTLAPLEQQQQQQLLNNNSQTQDPDAGSNRTKTDARPMFQKLPHKNNSSSSKFDYLCSLTRHEGPVNAVAFSPDGLHLATAGETGAVLVWSVPVSKRGGGNGRHFWATLGGENDLQVRRVNHRADGVADLSWSADSKRFMAGSMDHSVWVCENVHHQDATSSSSSQQQHESDWRVVYHNGMDHTHYVQGVAYDPLGVYLASMSSDRSVRVYPRKKSAAMSKGSKKKQALRPHNSPNESSSTTTAATATAAAASTTTAAPRTVQEILSDTKLELGRSKEIRKLRRSKSSSTDDTDENLTAPKQSCQHLFADEATLGSFVRRLSWTTDGAFLVLPAALWSEEPSYYATLLFARHNYDEPYRVLPHGLDKPSVAVRPNPVLFQLPAAAKENQSPSSASAGLPYRSIFCILTWGSVLVYDTFHTQPLAMIQGLHYANLVDATWSADGHTLIVCSTDGYLSLIQFARGELGQVYTAPVSETVSTTATVRTTPVPAAMTTTAKPRMTAPTALLPPCEPGPVVVENARPAKKAKRAELVPITTIGFTTTTKRPATDDDAHEEAQVMVQAAVDKLTLKTNSNATGSATCTTDQQPSAVVTVLQPKKKKRIQPLLLETTAQQ